MDCRSKLQLHRLHLQASASLHNYYRWALAAQGSLDKLFSLADTDHNGRIDLREFAYALAKMNPELPLAEARDAATDFFILFKADATR